MIAGSVDVISFLGPGWIRAKHVMLHDVATLVLDVTALAHNCRRPDVTGQALAVSRTRELGDISVDEARLVHDRLAIQRDPDPLGFLADPFDRIHGHLLGLGRATSAITR